MKSLYICGDSFGYPDPKFGKCWVDILKDKLSDTYEIVNLSNVSASNLQIAAQVDLAIKNKANYIIYSMTSSTREDIAFDISKDHLAHRYVNFVEPKFGSLLSYSIHSIDSISNLSDSDKGLLREYNKRFADLDLMIFKNECIIDSVLFKLVESNIPFIYDQGGFEHPKFGVPKKENYFARYSKFKSIYNLWDHCEKQTFRPYYHVSDNAIHEQVAEYYYNKINEQT